MKKMIIFITVLLIMISNVQAETEGSGYVEKVDLDNAKIVIGHAIYQIKKNKTRLFSGRHQLKLKLLKKGTKVKFVVDDNSILTEIRMITPYKFRS